VPADDPLTPRPPHFPARAKSVIYLGQIGAPSQLDLFDYKPELIQRDSQPMPASALKGEWTMWRSSTRCTPTR
jgi:hypothetical protein